MCICVYMCMYPCMCVCMCVHISECAGECSSEGEGGYIHLFPSLYSALYIPHMSMVVLRLFQGDILIRVNNVKVTSVRQVNRLIEKSKGDRYQSLSSFIVLLLIGSPY